MYLDDVQPPALLLPVRDVAEEASVVGGENGAAARVRAEPEARPVLLHEAQEDAAAAALQRLPEGRQLQLGLRRPAPQQRGT